MLGETEARSYQCPSIAEEQDKLEKEGKNQFFFLPLQQVPTPWSYVLLRRFPTYLGKRRIPAARPPAGSTSQLQQLYIITLQLEIMSPLDRQVPNSFRKKQCNTTEAE